MRSYYVLTGLLFLLLWIMEMNANEHSTAGPLGHGETEQRMSKKQELAEAGCRPYGCAFSITDRLSQIRVDFEEGNIVRAAGRLMTIRPMGKSIFADLYDGSGRFQVYAGESCLTDKEFAAFKLLDSGDFIGAEGDLFVTRTGEKTIRIKKWTLLAKALRPLPEKWHGLKDVEIRYRQRYLDLISNPGVRDLFNKRIQVIREIRSFLWARGFSEVETPMLQPQSGGATAKPFQTRYEALNANMFLRIAPELYLKRLLVGGFDRIFELNRNFRNEGISKTHNPEFTMLEVYQAYSDMQGMKKLAESLITTVAQKVFGTLQVGRENDHPVDLATPWHEITYRQLILEKMGADWFDLTPEAARERAVALGLTIDTNWNHLQITHEVYEKAIERQIEQPTFVTRLPFELVPLAKVCDDDPTVVDVFELVVCGREIGPGYSELNDPIEQRKRFEAQAGPDAQKVDEDFLLAQEHGMPPAGGMGIGIDRLMMILAGVGGIRDVILFPQLRLKK